MRLRILAFWLLFAVTLAVYLVMVVWTLPTISAEAGGLPAFDVRPGGYTRDEARAFLGALSPAGKTIYLGAQHRLDLFYPALLAATLFMATIMLAPGKWGGFRWLLAFLALPGAVFDYLENGAVTGMLETGPDGLTSVMVEQASRFTVLKSIFSALSMTIVLVLVFVWIWHRWRGAEAQ